MDDLDMPAPRLDLAPEQRAAIAEQLRLAGADTYALYGKAHGYHWNVVGSNFAGLHTLFETQYNELWSAVDDMAERIRALGGLAPQGFDEVATLSGVKGGDPQLDAAGMVEDLLDGHQTVIDTLRRALSPAEAADDQVTQGLIADRLAAHEKQAWMLRATLGRR